jgi:hypothetical protein
VFGDVSVSGGATFNIDTTKPQTTAPSAGLALASPNAINVTFAGNSNVSVQGAIYIPNGNVTMNGNINSACAQVIAGTISVGGNVSLDNNGNCGMQKVTGPGPIALVE